MNILHISNRDHGGAGFAAHNLHNLMLKSGFNSKLLVLDKKMKDGNIISVLPLTLTQKFSKKIKNTLINNLKSNSDYYFENQKSTLISYRSLKRKIPFNPDVIIIHWISAFVNFKEIWRLQKETNAMVIFHLLDMGLITGGCHYAWYCDHYKRKCGFCPAIFSQKGNDISNENWKFKKRYIDKIDCLVVAPTQWLLNQTQSSGLFHDKPVKKIMLGIDKDLFSPENKKKIHEDFNIPANNKSIFIGSESFKEKRKGFQYLVEAFEILVQQFNFSPQNITLIFAGKSEVNGSSIFKKFNIIKTGYITDEKLLSNCYRAADIFISSSIEDSGPMMINESLMSGTPIVAFDMGVALDLVINGETGYRARNKDSEDLAIGLFTLLNLSEEEHKKYSIRCREMALRLTSSQTQISQFEQLINSKKMHG